MFWLTRSLTLGLVLASVCATGCFDSPKANVSGEVTLDGKLLETGTIRFVPVDGQSQAADATITNGKYSLTMSPGEKRVEISAPKVVGRFKMIDTPESPWVDKVEELLPARYNAASTTTWSAVGGNQTKSFELTSK